MPDHTATLTAPDATDSPPVPPAEPSVKPLLPPTLPQSRGPGGSALAASSVVDVGWFTDGRFFVRSTALSAVGLSLRLRQTRHRMPALVDPLDRAHLEARLLVALAAGHGHLRRWRSYAKADHGLF
jgi:hypothetical protein